MKHDVEKNESTCIISLYVICIGWQPVTLSDIERCNYLHRLENVQNSATEWLGVPKDDYISPIKKDIHWLPFMKRIGFRILLLAFKYMQGCVSPYLRELLVKKATTRDSWIKHENALPIPHSNLKRVCY